MSVQIQLRRSTTSEWATANPVLAQGEPGYDYTLKRLKIGDGTTNWDDLPLVNLTGVMKSLNKSFVGDVTAFGYAGNFNSVNTKIVMTGINVPFDCSVDGAYISFNSATIGNCMIGIYGPVSNVSTLGTLPLVASTASVAVPTTSGSVTITAKIPLTIAELPAGMYIFGIQFATGSKGFNSMKSPGQPFFYETTWEKTNTYGTLPSSMIFDNASNATIGTNCPSVFLGCTPL